jgi:hypothetical protein
MHFERLKKCSVEKECDGPSESAAGTPVETCERKDAKCEVRIENAAGNDREVNQTCKPGNCFEREFGDSSEHRIKKKPHCGAFQFNLKKLCYHETPVQDVFMFPSKSDITPVFEVVDLIGDQNFDCLSKLLFK